HEAHHRSLGRSHLAAIVPYPRRVGFGIDRVARSRKGRGLFRKAPDPKDVAMRLGRLARRMLGSAFVRSGNRGDRFVVELRLLPPAPAATLTVESDATLVWRGETAPLGPGYHAELVARIDPLLEELDFVWTDVFDPAANRAAMCAWLVDALRAGPVRF